LAYRIFSLHLAFILRHVELRYLFSRYVSGFHYADIFSLQLHTADYTPPIALLDTPIARYVAVACSVVCVAAGGIFMLPLCPAPSFHRFSDIIAATSRRHDTLNNRYYFASFAD